MERKFISIDGLKKVLNPKELKNVLGGSGGEGINPYDCGHGIGMTLTGVECRSGQCYCDFWMCDGEYPLCGIACEMSDCSQFGGFTC